MLLSLSSFVHFSKLVFPPIFQDANISQTGDQVILVGAASKGIIQRGFQHNAMVYKAPYAKNPFDTVTDDELEEYKKTVTRKVRGDGCKCVYLCVFCLLSF